MEPFCKDLEGEMKMALQKYSEDKQANLTLPPLQKPTPVGCIEYLAPSGKVAERIEYNNAEEFVQEIRESNWYGEPMNIIVYKDPETGKHIDTSWTADLDPLPQGLKIEEYREGQENELVAPETEAPEIPEEDFEMES